MTQLWSFIQAHPFGTFFVAAILVEQLPPPTEESSEFYKYIYSVLQALVANWRRTKDAYKLIGSK
jgi:hypothetical protein